MKKAKNIIIEQWSEEVASILATESFKSLREFKKPNGNPRLLQDLGVRFIKTYVEHLVENIFTSTTEEEHMRMNFFQTKTELQTAIADAFEKGIANGTGKYVHYYCTINPIPEPKSKELN